MSGECVAVGIRSEGERVCPSGGRPGVPSGKTSGPMTVLPTSGKTAQGTTVHPYSSGLTHV